MKQVYIVQSCPKIRVHKIQIAGSRRKTQNKKQDRHFLELVLCKFYLKE
jgi:hypothetical protein